MHGSYRMKRLAYQTFIRKFISLFLDTTSNLFSLSQCNEKCDHSPHFITDTMPIILPTLKVLGLYPYSYNSKTGAHKFRLKSINIFYSIFSILSVIIITCLIIARCLSNTGDSVQTLLTSNVTQVPIEIYAFIHEIQGITPTLEMIMLIIYGCIINSCIISIHLSISFRDICAYLNEWDTFSKTFHLLPSTEVRRKNTLFTMLLISNIPAVVLTSKLDEMNLYVYSLDCLSEKIFRVDRIWIKMQNVIVATVSIQHVQICMYVPIT